MELVAHRTTYYHAKNRRAAGQAFGPFRTMTDSQSGNAAGRPKRSKQINMAASTGPSDLESHRKDLKTVEAINLKTQHYIHCLTERADGVVLLPISQSDSAPPKGYLRVAGDHYPVL